MKGFIPKEGKFWCVIDGIKIIGHLTNYGYIIDSAETEGGFDLTYHNSVICELQDKVEPLFRKEFEAYWKKRKEEME